MGLELEISLEKDSYAPGEEVRGVINVLEGDTARYVEVAIAQVEMTSDYTDVLRSLSMGTVHTGDLATGMSIPFSAPLPPDARPNVIGIGSIVWRIEANVDRKGFNKSLTTPIPLVVPPPSEAPPLPAGSGPVIAGGVEGRPGRGSLFAVLAVIALLGVATFFALQKWLSYDDPQLPEGAALQAELEQRFGDTSWFVSITSVEGDSPDPGDMSIDTNLAHDEVGSATVSEMCGPLIDYLAEKDVEGTTIFIHSTDDKFVKGQVILGTDWTCEEDGVDDF
jgi:hypothetical protein